MARKESINVALVLAADEDPLIENVDADTAFLYGEVKEEIYMNQPDALYGTKQAAREWNNRLNAHLEGQGFNRTAADLCIYVWRSEMEFSLMIFHVDDLMIFARTQEHVDETKRYLKSEFSIKEVRALKYCLGIKLHRDQATKTILMNQRAYIKRLAEKLGVDKCKDVHTPANESEKLIKLDKDDIFVPKWPYR
uniref:Hypothetical retrotransposon n=1 Tax=Albugo laibachii Nc14 TaxID=890382 RepID=F0WKV9_9STRA|nr:hypothetical retrotransposon [Albugo laibachii Nc14]|eukprot:CCA21917.1 hypothetical retrotransposon [Albugo laibachii Nc14]